ncbi:MAG TPA: beta-N-acetylhexosaminidase [Gammaproteobacteria bacterium]|jgi:beta-N-acetylhexosaminidase|nr:beta-N-acetylhexosaminidase [Gammaproteobacteria bacterium]
MNNTFGCVMLDLMGTELDPEEREILQHPLVGGVILFTRNYASPAQLSALCRAIRAARPDPLLIGVDQEGGRVQRFRDDFTRLPSMGFIGQKYENVKSDALNLAENCGWIMGAELLSVGIDFSFAPVLDLYDKNNPVIGDRGFHANPAVVTELAKSVMQGMRESGMPSVGKHFPGHGSVNIDSHFTLPRDDRHFDQILENDLQPFLELIRAGIDGIMPAHIIFSSVDTHPVGFSERWLLEILRKKYHFSGMIFSDDLNMQAANFAGTHVERALNALNAGCNMILICNNRPSALQILDQVPQKYFIDAHLFKRLQGKFSNSFSVLQKTQNWQEKNKQLMRMTELESDE